MALCVGLMPWGASAQTQDRRFRLPPVALGVSLTRVVTTADSLDNAIKIGPTIRIGSGQGLGGVVGFGWFKADWREAADGAPLARVRVRPLMGGVSYGIRRAPMSLSVSLVAGPSFNSFTLPVVRRSAIVPLDIPTSLAVRPGTSVWIDVDDRVSINVGAAYLITRPRVRVFDGNVEQNRVLRADGLHLSAGVAYRLF